MKHHIQSVAPERKKHSLARIKGDNHNIKIPNSQKREKNSDLKRDFFSGKGERM